MIGIDLLKIERFEEVFEKYGMKFLKRIFTEREISSYFQQRRKRVAMQELAARFAGKEAISKALGTGIKSLGSGRNTVSWKEIEVLSESTGKPTVSLYGKAEKVAEELEFKKIHVSLTHIENLTAAIAFAEKTNDR